MVFALYLRRKKVENRRYSLILHIFFLLGATLTKENKCTLRKKGHTSNVVADFLEQKTVAILRIYPNFFHSLREDVFVVNNRHRKKVLKLGLPEF